MVNLREIISSEGIVASHSLLKIGIDYWSYSEIPNENEEKC